RPAQTRRKAPAALAASLPTSLAPAGGVGRIPRAVLVVLPELPILRPPLRALDCAATRALPPRPTEPVMPGGPDAHAVRAGTTEGVRDAALLTHGRSLRSCGRLAAPAVQSPVAPMRA